MARDITPEEQQMVDEMVARARAAMEAIADYDQATADRLAQAIGWAIGNEKTFTRLAHMSVDESGIGDREGRPNKRFKIQGITREGKTFRPSDWAERLAGALSSFRPGGVSGPHGHIGYSPYCVPRVVGG